MKVLSIQIGRPKEIQARGKTWSTGHFKSSTEGPQFLDKLGFVGDHHVHLEVHGGEDRALYAFSESNYEFWKPHLPAEIIPEPGLFGENITVEKLIESEVHVGDTFELGDVVLQATMPRFPCFLFAARVKIENAIELMYESQRPGVLFRVLQTGFVKKGDSLKLREKSKINLSMSEFLLLTRVGTFTRNDWEYLKNLNFFTEKLLTRLEKNIST